MSEKMEYQDQVDTSSLNQSTMQNDTSLLNTTSGTQNDTTISSRPVGKSIKVASNYFDIDDILSMSERVPCRIEQDLVKMGYLDQSTDDEHLARGTKLELPLWFAREFHSEQIKVLKIEAPKGYNETFRHIFEADANVVDLNKICMNFYRFGEHLVDLDFEESNEIAAMLENVFKQRIHHILNYSLNAKSETVNEGMSFKKKLDNLELQLYRTGKSDLNQFLKWEENQLHKIDTNEFVINLKKRKQAASTAGLSKN